MVDLKLDTELGILGNEETMIMVDMVPQEGWNYVAFNVINKNDHHLEIEGYNFAHNFYTYNSTLLTQGTTTQLWDDTGDTHLCIGGHLSAAATVVEPFIGMIHEVRFFEEPLGEFQIYD